ncbi:uncharacterized protein LOC127749883 [Frankliniella occidentalis]|uniref:Uncharacterized protein LOC127749883 n=1 Tax=Frankliniella occidentalis TaxID=133901 RepID=A0A9C6U9V1_FRAOC|nr:uncharacterized protein LOC127749883 [Frankliniella occidentalis]
MTATRVREFRMAWVRLRQLSEGCVAMPTTVLALLMYLIMQTTLCTYQGLVSSLAGFHTFASICAIISVQIFAGVVIMCDAGHRAAQAMKTDFATPLQKLFFMHAPNQETVNEMRTFLGVISSRAPAITCAGFCQLTRQTVTGVSSVGSRGAHL